MDFLATHANHDEVKAINVDPMGFRVALPQCK
jgi:hypothetical protein